MARSTVKKKVVKIDDDPRWLKAVNFFIKNGAGDAGQAMIEAGFPKTTAKGKCQLLRKHPAYLKWVEAKTKKNLITKEYLEQKLYNIIEENGRDRIGAIGKAMEMFGYIAPKQSEVTGKDGKPIAMKFTFGDANLKPQIPDAKNRMGEYN